MKKQYLDDILRRIEAEKLPQGKNLVVNFHFNDPFSNQTGNRVQRSLKAVSEDAYRTAITGSGYFSSVPLRDEISGKSISYSHVYNTRGNGNLNDDPFEGARMLSYYSDCLKRAVFIFQFTSPDKQRVIKLLSDDGLFQGVGNELTTVSYSVVSHLNMDQSDMTNQVKLVELLDNHFLGALEPSPYILRMFNNKGWNLYPIKVSHITVGDQKMRCNIEAGPSSVLRNNEHYVLLPRIFNPNDSEEMNAAIKSHFLIPPTYSVNISTKLSQLSSVYVYGVSFHDGMGCLYVDTTRAGRGEADTIIEMPAYLFADDLKRNLSAYSSGVPQ